MGYRVIQSPRKTGLEPLVHMTQRRQILELAGW